MLVNCLIISLLVKVYCQFIVVLYQYDVIFIYSELYSLYITILHYRELVLLLGHMTEQLVFRIAGNLVTSGDISFPFWDKNHRISLQLSPQLLSTSCSCYTHWL